MIFEITAVFEHDVSDIFCHADHPIARGDEATFTP